MLLLALVALAHGTTDHPQHRAWEEAVGQPPPAATQQLRRAPKARVPLQWTLSTEGIPCQLPFSGQGVQYQSLGSCGAWLGAQELPPGRLVLLGRQLRTVGGMLPIDRDAPAAA